MKRRTDIDIMRGLAMICVLVGQIFGTYLNNGTYVEYSRISQLIFDLIYSFHMPLLFVISGYVEHMVSAERSEGINMRKVVIVMMAPYMFFSALQIIMKGILGMQQMSLGAFLRVLIEPISGLWFLYALFIFKVISLKIRENHMNKWLVGTLCLCAMLVATIGGNLPGIVFYVFAFGFSYFVGYILYNNHIHGWQYLLAVIMLVIGETAYFNWNEIFGKTIVGISLFVLGQGLLKKKTISVRPLEFIGLNSMVFYIIDGFTNSPVTNILWRIGVTNFWIVSMVSLLIKLLIPYFVIKIGEHWQFVMGFFYPTKWTWVKNYCEIDGWCLKLWNEKVDKHKQKIIMILVKVFVSCGIVLPVLITGVKLLARTGDSELKSYHVTESYVEQIETKECYRTEFLCVGKVMDALHIEADTQNGESGYVSYEIMDDTGKIVVADHLDIQKLERDDAKGLFIDVSDLSLQQGEFYTLSMDFSETSALVLTLGSGKLSIRQYFYSPYQTWYRITLVTIFVLSLVWLWFAYKKHLNYRLFAITVLFVGVFTALVMPPANRDDEYRHFMRSYVGAMNDIDKIYDVPNGNENGLFGFAMGDEEPMAEVPYQINELRLMDSENVNGHGYLQEVNYSLCLDKLIALSKGKTRDESYRVSLNATADRSVIYYWPQIFLMKIFSFLGSDCVWLYYIARIGQVLACVMFETIAIRIAPSIKELIWLVALIPNTILLQASCNCDGILIAEIILLVAIVVWLKENQVEMLTLKGAVGWIFYFILSYNIIKMKIPYGIICLGTLILLTKENFKIASDFIKKYKKKVIWIGGGILALACVGIIFSGGAFIWKLVYSFVPKAHVDYIFENPNYIYMLFSNKWFEMVRQLYDSMKGGNRISYPGMMIVLILLMKKEYPVWKRLAVALIFGVMIMVIVLVGYTLTPPYHGVIWGITFRYLLPFVSYGALCLPAGNEKTEKISMKLAPLCIFFMVSQTLLSWAIGWWT